MALYNGFCIVKPYYSMPTLLVQICIRVSAIPHAYTVYCIITDIYTYTVHIYVFIFSHLQLSSGGSPRPTLPYGFFYSMYKHTPSQPPPTTGIPASRPANSWLRAVLGRPGEVPPRYHAASPSSP